MRPDGRANDELRPYSFERDFTAYAQGSVLVIRIPCRADGAERMTFPWQMRGASPEIIIFLQNGCHPGVTSQKSVL